MLALVLGWNMAKKRKKMRGKVAKIIPPVVSSEPEKAEITVEDAEDLYREIRVENVLTDEQGEKVRLKPGASVDVVLEAESDATQTIGSAGFFSVEWSKSMPEVILRYIAPKNYAGNA